MKALVFFPLKNIISFLNLANFFINYVKEPPCTQSTPSSCRCSQWELINTTLWRNKNKYECLVGYNFRCSFKGGRQIYIQMKACVLPLKNVISFLNLANFFINYVKEPPCTQSTPSSCRCSQWELINTTSWRNKYKYECLVEYNFRSFQGRPTNLYPNESLCSPLEECYIIFEFGQFLHTLKSLRVHLGLIQWELINTIHCEEIKINMNVWLGITSDVFKGGRQIYIQMKACVLPLKNECYIIFEFGQFLHKLC